MKADVQLKNITTTSNIIKQYKLITMRRSYRLLNLMDILLSFRVINGYTWDQNGIKGIIVYKRDRSKE